MEIVLSLNQSKFGKFILFMLLLLLLFFLNNNISFKINKNSKLFKIINKNYIFKNYVNINEIESLFPGRRKWTKNKKNVINIGIQLDPNYILRVMMTLASIIDSQKPETKLRFHFAVVHNFNVEHMLKIYSLRGRIRDDIEFNFYNAKKSEIDLRNLNPKGPGAVAKLLLPNLLPKDVERLIIFDTGDLLVLRDLTLMYNWKMDNYICLGIPGGKIRKYAYISKKKYVRYINTGSILINVKKYKFENIYDKCVKNKDIYHNEIADQDLLNDILFGKIGYLPFKFGMRSPYGKDTDSDIVLRDNPYSYYSYAYSKVNYTFNPQNYSKFMQLGYNPIVIHQFNGKWMNGKGLTIYRRIAQYYIRMAGIWNEMCNEFPGYCKK
jgi:hypothetical protein